VARAKRTARAEARRRYRAANPTEPFDDEDEVAEDEAPLPSTATRASGQPSKASTPAPKPVGMVAAFKTSFRPFRPADDIRAFPQVALHSNAVWIPLLITVASTVAVLITGGADVVTAFLFAYFVQTPAIGGVFIAGFLAPRASWLVGVVVGLVAAIGYSIYIVVAAGKAVPPADPQVVRDAIVSALILSPLLGAFFAAGAAWYRRFLAMSNPNRGRPSKGQPTKRSGDGKSRAGTSQKAGVRR
jgi:hypothetical protein